MDEIQALGDVFKLRPEVFLQGLAALGNVRASDENKLKEQTLANQYAEQANPLRIRSLDLQNQGADTTNQINTRKLSELKEPTKVDWKQAPQVYSGLAAMAETMGNNPAALAALKQQAGPYWLPHMDQWAPGSHAANFNTMANKLIEHDTKYRTALDRQGSSNEGAAEVARIRAASAEKVARISAEARKSIAAAVAEAKKQNSPKTLEALQARYEQLASEAKDEDVYNTYKALAAEVANRRITEKFDAARIRSEGNPDLSKLAKPIPTTPKAPLPAAPDIPRAASGAAAPVKYNSDTEVREAFKAGKLTREQALQILRTQFGHN